MGLTEDQEQIVNSLTKIESRLETIIAMLDAIRHDQKEK